MNARSCCWRREEAETRRQQLVDEARAKFEHARRMAPGHGQREAGIVARLPRTTCAATLHVVRRTLKNLANAHLERQMLSAFLDTRRLDSQEREVMTEAIRASDREVELRIARSRWTRNCGSRSSRSFATTLTGTLRSF